MRVGEMNGTRCKVPCGVGMTCCREKGVKRGANGNIFSINQICTYFEDIVRTKLHSPHVSDLITITIKESGIGQIMIPLDQKIVS